MMPAYYAEKCIGEGIEKHSWEKYIARLEHVYEAVIHREPIHSI